MDRPSDRSPVDEVEAGRAQSAFCERSVAVPRGFLREGNPRTVLDAACRRMQAGEEAVLALVLDTEGSTYAGAGDMVLFANDTQVGWLSGGCLEQDLATRAERVDAMGRIEWVEIDTRGDEDLLSGSARGCRGRLRIALLPLRAMPGIAELFAVWLRGGVELQRELRTTGEILFRVGDRVAHWRLPALRDASLPVSASWSLPLGRLPRVLVLGAGPETPTLVPMLRALGWWVGVAERRARWDQAAQGADARFLAGSVRAIAEADCDVALVMHHDFELDREALDALACSDIGLVGLLGPRRRRDDLFRLLTPQQRERLVPRLRSPVGMDIGGRGPEAIALSIAAELQHWRATVAA